MMSERFQRYQTEQELAGLRQKIQRQAKEHADYVDAEHDELVAVLERLDRIEAFLKRKFLEEWDSFEAKP